MEYAIGFAMLSLSVLIFFRPRGHRWGVICLKNKSEPREQIIKLKTLKEKGLIWKKISYEIRVFNGLNIIMMARRGIPILYSDWLSKLLINPKARPTSNEPFERLMYLYAAARLYQTSNDPLIKKQLYKNCLYVFGIASSGSGCLIKRKNSKSNEQLQTQDYINDGTRCLLGLRNAQTHVPSPSRQKACKHSMSFFSHPQPLYKLLCGETFSKFTNRASNVRFTNSYAIITTPDGAIIKNYVDKTLPVQCYEVLQGNHRFVWNCTSDKMKTNISHTSDTFWWTSTSPMEEVQAKKNSKHFADIQREYGDLGAILVLGSKVNFETSLAEKTAEMNVYINATAGTKIYIIYGSTKPQISETIAKIKKQGGRLDYLMSPHQTAFVDSIQQLYHKAKTSHFVVGENLKSRYQATQKFIPTLSLPTLVYDITEPQEFFDIIDNFNHFKQITHTNQNLNVILLHSSQNELIQNHIKAFTDRNQAQDLIKSGVFLFFIDRVKTPNDVIYYLSKMAENKSSFVKRRDSNSNILVEDITTATFPITHSAICYNKSQKPQSALITIPIELTHFHAISRKNAQLTATNLRTGRTTIYKLPNGSQVSDASGNTVEKSESITNKIDITVNVKFAPHEEKTFTVTKNENALSIKERKNAFMGSLENIRVISANKTLEKVFTLPMARTTSCGSIPNSFSLSSIKQSEDDTLLTSLKSALKNFNQDMFFALLSTITEIPSDTFALIIEKVIGLRLLRGKIQIIPNIIISGAFELSFDYKGTTYHFTIKQKHGGFSVLHNGIQYTNFLQIGV